MAMRDSAIFYRSFYEAIKELPDTNQARIYSAIFEFSLNGIEVELTGLDRTVFTLIRPQLEANMKRFENGKKPKVKQTESKTEAKQKQNGSKTEAKVKQTESKVEANNNVNVNENVNDNLNENENENAVQTSAPKVATKKNKDEKSISYQMEEVWTIYLQKHFDVTYMHSARDRKILNEISQKLLFQINEKQKKTGIITSETDQQKILNAWIYILNNRDKWSNFHQGLKELSAINSQLITILTDSKNGTSKNSRHQVDPVQLATEAINISRDAAARRANGTGQMPQD